MVVPRYVRVLQERNNPPSPPAYDYQRAPQGPRLECELADGELIIVGSRQPVLDDDRRVPGWLVDRVPGLWRSLLLDRCYEPRDERVFRRRRAAEDGDISRGDGRTVVGHITERAGT